MDDPTVLQAKRFGVYHCLCTTTLFEAARLMADEDISALVVVDNEGYLAGIITRIDLLRASHEVSAWFQEPVENWMSRQVVTVTPHDHLSHVAQLLLEKQIHRVVAVQGEGSRQRPLAVISSADLVYHLAKSAKAHRVPPKGVSHMGVSPGGVEDD